MYMYFFSDNSLATSIFCVFEVIEKDDECVDADEDEPQPMGDQSVEVCSLLTRCTVNCVVCVPYWIRY